MILVFLAITSGTILAVVVVVKVKEAKESRIRRTTATPYGVLMGPTDAELRRTREVHPENIEIVGVWKKDCPACDGVGHLVVGKRKGLTCWRCGGQGDISIQEEEPENDGKTGD